MTWPSSVDDKLAKTDCPKCPRLLLVEDSDDDAFFFQRTLQRSGLSCSVHHVTDGAQAVELLRSAAASDQERLPSVIFLDLKMPVLNGFEVLEWMRTQTFPFPIQVVVLSGSEHENDKTRAAALGASDYLVKPITITDLHRLLQEISAPAVGKEN